MGYLYPFYLLITYVAYISHPIKIILIDDRQYFNVSACYATGKTT